MTALTLTGEQKKVLSLPVENPVLIKGTAGSGKTTVAVYRARHLMATQEDLFRPARVALFSYTNPLARYVRVIIGDTACEVSTLHSYAGRLLYHAGVWLNVEQDRNTLEGYVRAALDAVRRRRGDVPDGALGRPLPFYQAEFAWIKGRCLADRATYLATARRGRGTAERVTAADKEVLWETYSAYADALSRAGKSDWDDIILRALLVTQTQGVVAPFTHIVVDEAQDLTLAQLSLVSRLVSPETHSITLVADSAQRIYQSGFTWSDTGLNVRGRSFEFRRNYRNTRPIAAAAFSLLSREEDRSEFTDAELPERPGARPRLLHAGSFERQVEAILLELRQVEPGTSVVVAAPTRRGVKRLSEALARNGITVVGLATNAAGCRQGVVIVDTLYAVKGIEFDHVILCELNAVDLAAQTGVADESETRSRNRKLLFVGMTRARQSLLLLTSGEPSPLLADIDPDMLDREVT